MPCRHRQCNIRGPPIEPCCHSRGSRHSIGIQVSGVPSVTTSCCPQSMRSYATTDEDFCTSDTCGNTEACVKTLPEHCPFGLKKEVSKDQQKNNHVEARESQIRICPEVSGTAHVHVHVKDAATSPRVSLEFGLTLQRLEIKQPNSNEEHATEPTKCRSDVREHVNFLKDTSTQVDSSGATEPSDNPNQNPLKDTENIEGSLNTRLGKVYSETQPCCNAIKKTFSEPVVPAQSSSLLKEKRSPRNISQKQSNESSCPMCSNGTCFKKEPTKCQCKYPPALSHVGCTGRLVGNCNCGK